MATITALVLGEYADELTSDSMLSEEWMTTLDSEKHRL
jgi:hypothetical protein